LESRLFLLTCNENSKKEENEEISSKGGDGGGLGGKGGAFTSQITIK
jgi:hypothetical protein